MALQIDVVIMAAGQGTRMKSSLPKVLHRLGGRALLAHVIDCATQLSVRRVVVITGHGALEVEAACGYFQGTAATLDLQFARQAPQLGTGHAMQQAVPLLADDGVTLVLSGDVPLTQAATLQALIDACDGQRLALLTLAMLEPSGYGRIVRSGTEASAQVRAIVEHTQAEIRTTSEMIRGTVQSLKESDDLKRIRGVGVLIEKKLNSLGVTRYDQVANWTQADIERFSDKLDFKGRIERENWVEQARILSAGGQTEFSRRVDRGEVETSKTK